MKLRINYNKFNNYGKQIYRKSEQSFDFEPDINSDFSLMLGTSYVGIETDLSTGRLLYLSGFSPMKSWEKSKLILPDFVDGTIYIEELKDCYAGMGISIGSDFRALYDEDIGLICFLCGENIVYNNCVRISPDVVIAINENNIVAIWIKPIIL